MRCFLAFMLIATFIVLTEQGDVSSEVDRIESIIVNCSGDGASNRKRLIFLGCKDCFIRLHDHDPVEAWISSRSESCHQNTTHLTVYSSSTHRIPSFIFVQFEKITKFEMTYQNLTTVSKADFLNAREVRTLNLTGNELETFDTNVLDFIPSIETLDLSHNNLSSITFTSYSLYLQHLYLNDNKLETVPAGIGIFTLTFVELSNNHIQRVDINAFLLFALRTLHLSGNKLNSFNSLNAIELVEVDVSHNEMNGTVSIDAVRVNISNTHTTICLVYPKVRVMTAANCSISEIIGDPYRDNSLTQLDLSGNVLTSISNLTAFPKLTKLDLSHNLLSTLNSEIFSSMPVLYDLRLSGNLLETFDFNHLPTVHYLDISYNYLMNFEIMANLPGLGELYVTGNYLTDLDSTIKAKAPNLLIYGINDNNFECNRLGISLLFLRLDDVTVDDRRNEHSLRHGGFSSNVRGIQCYYRDTSDVEERLSKVEQKVDLVMRTLLPEQISDKPKV